MLSGGGGLTRLLAPAFVAGAVLGGALAFAVTGSPDKSAAAGPRKSDLATRKAAFRRPAQVPFPADNPYSEKKRALGDKLFHDRRLSLDDSISCASCHDRNNGYADGVAKGQGVPGRKLARHTPTLWNLAWSRQMFWDGRARSLEEQVSFPIENPDEMAQPLPDVIAKLSADPKYVRMFAEAFPDDPHIDAVNLAKALATYERGLVSPETRFDRWVDGDAQALTPNEVKGFDLFTGKAQCSNCHTGWAFTDSAFYDIGLKGDDRGRGAVLRISQANYSFKVPGLRELSRSAPYMHDGSIKTIEEAVRHYEAGVVKRPTLASDLPHDLKLTDTERASLVAFLKTLTGDEKPKPPEKIVAVSTAVTSPAVAVSSVAQDDKAFHPRHVKIKRGARLWIVNNDSRTHNVRVFDEKFEFDSGAQEPGETIEMTFPATGSFLVFCGIHPKMELFVDVKP